MNVALPDTYCQVSVATGSRMVCLSGQVAKLTVCVPHWSQEKMGELIGGAMRAAQDLIEVEAMAVLP